MSLKLLVSIAKVYIHTLIESYMNKGNANKQPLFIGVQKSFKGAPGACEQLLPPEEVYVLQHLVYCMRFPTHTPAFFTLTYVRSTCTLFLYSSYASALSSTTLHYIYLCKATSVKKLPGDGDVILWHRDLDNDNVQIVHKLLENMFHCLN